MADMVTKPTESKTPQWAERWVDELFPEPEGNSHGERFYRATKRKELAALLAQKIGPLVEWVSVKDQMPEEGKYVLAFEPHGGIFMGFKLGISWCDSRGITRSLEQITHWMPLPEPPRVILRDFTGQGKE